MKKALITGINGQTASYLAELLLDKGYEVHGTIRRNSVPESQTTRISHLHDKGLVSVHYMDLIDPISVEQIISSVQPDEVYHLAAQSHVQISFAMPKYTLDVNAGGTLAVLESVRRFSPHSKVYHAATSEMFGNNIDSDGYQRETTKMVPVSPYGASKLYAHNLCNNYRNSYDIFVASGICFNHESPRRGINFVTNKVCKGAVEIYKGKANKLVLGNLESYRDWSHAKDMAMAIWMMLQLDKPGDFVCSSGVTNSVRHLCYYVFDKLGMDYKDFVVSSEKYLRPEELDFLKGDSSKFRLLTGWQPTYDFEAMIDEMIEYWISNDSIYK